MKISWVLAAYLLAAATFATAETHLIVISVDGLRPEVYLHPEREELKVPNLLRLRDQGVAAERMLGIFPTVTYPSHVTLVTGTNPTTHKVGTNFIRGTTNWHLNAADIQSETLWQAYRKAGFSTAIVTWPATYGAEVDWLVPENLSLNMSNAADDISKGATPGLFIELEQEAGRFHIPPLDTAGAYEQLDAMTAAYAAVVVRRHRPNFMLIHFLDADHQQHAFGPRSPQAHQAFERTDAYIGVILNALSDAGIATGANIVIVGDHGFAPVEKGINLSKLLVDIGYAKIENQQTVTQVVDMMSSGGSASFYAKRNASARELKDFQVKLARAVSQSYEGLLKYLSQSELQRLGGYPDAIAAVTTSAGYLLLDAPGPRVILPMPSLGGHGYPPNMPEMATGFIATGPAFRQGVRLPLMRILDVAPTLGAINNVPLPQAEGIVVKEILRPN